MACLDAERAGLEDLGTRRRECPQTARLSVSAELCSRGTNVLFGLGPVIVEILTTAKCDRRLSRLPTTARLFPRFYQIRSVIAGAKWFDGIVLGSSISSQMGHFTIATQPLGAFFEIEDYGHAVVQVF